MAYEDPITKRSYNLLDAKDEARVRELIKRDRPRLIVASPPCTLFSILQNLNAPPSPVEMEKGIHLFDVAIRLCQFQMKRGGLFLLEHPKTSKAWRLPAAVDLQHTAGVWEMVIDQCQYGLKTQDAWGEGFAMKPTKFLTNSPAIAAKLARRCCGGH